MSAWQVCLTFDIDLIDHAGDSEPLDEFATAVPALQRLFDRHPHWVATWFVRLDDRIAALFGDAGAIFEKHAKVLDTLRDRGHEIAWHPHAYVRAATGEWRQNVDETSVADELLRLGPLAKSRGLSVVRTGWGFHSNVTMRAIADAGFRIDSSAIPRPKYDWDRSIKDWTLTPLAPYRPSRRDYRVPGDPDVGVLELPISVGGIASPDDTQPVIRYFNPAFAEAAFIAALPTWFDRFSHLIPVTHPYEMVPGAPHALLAHDPSVFERNVEAVEQLARQRGRIVAFQTLSQLARSTTSDGVAP